MTRAALYARVSTEDQAERGYSLEAQRVRLRSYCSAQGWDIAGEYVDDGYTGRDTRRPEYGRMMAERDSWDSVLVLKMDRIHRNSRNFMGMMDDLRTWGKDFVSATESLDTSTAMGRFVIDILQRIAQLESEVIGERVYLGMSQKAKTGRGFNGFNVPLGYDRTGAGELGVNEREAETVRTIFKRCLKGKPTWRIAATLNDDGIPAKRGGRWSHPRVLYILHNPLYAGFVRWDGNLRPNGHAAIVDVGTFNRAQRALQRRVRNRTLKREPMKLPLSP